MSDTLRAEIGEAILKDDAGEAVKYCETHNTIAGHKVTTHDVCGTREITLAEFWNRTSKH